MYTEIKNVLRHLKKIKNIIRSKVTPSSFFYISFQNILYKKTSLEYFMQSVRLINTKVKRKRCTK